MRFCPSYTTTYLTLPHQYSAKYGLVYFTNKIYITITKQLDDLHDLLSVLHIKCVSSMIKHMCLYFNEI